MSGTRGGEVVRTTVIVRGPGLGLGGGGAEGYATVGSGSWRWREGLSRAGGSVQTSALPSVTCWAQGLWPGERQVRHMASFSPSRRCPGHPRKLNSHRFQAP